MSDNSSLSEETLEQRIRDTVQDRNSGFYNGYNLIVLGDSPILNSVEWDSFSPELFLRSSVSAQNSMLLDNLLGFLCWEMDSRYSAMEMMGVNHIDDLISSPIPYCVIFDDSSRLHQLPLIWNKLKRLLNDGHGAGIQVFVAVD